MSKKKYRDEWEQLDDAMFNTYLLLTKRKELSEIIENGEEFTMSLNKRHECNINKTIDSLLEYFISTEDYEICAELVKIKDEEKAKLKYLFQEEEGKKKRNTQQK